mmetsp:Transcript_43860/g.105824  ORF Transcript_43860/g.105824 Transcript_43860/m.105824 type:complete len:499 (-) Transcript_43860:1196-2692(-)|eukprot:CAMPEP_0113619476 /NCGR_PEP_ID=MMETSP0017_2-20120614/9891_1 /TAXON_ID=2856 /ORGANISM="Cylindrotheca closterium" /LENGTH=498 /DNA_ID=CAMNT_0000529055 /DNA_START=27 /DNA_END=1523 /DNA_ORIENTATION=- /assembly_acc=CAM_ASM_000147
MDTSTDLHDIPESLFGAEDGQELEEQQFTEQGMGAKELAACHGYNYEYGDVPDEDDLDGSTLLNENSLRRSQPMDPRTAFTTKSGEKIPYIYVVGKTFHPTLEFQLRKDFQASLYWFTYRSNFPEIRPYGITSDAGWGCMLRSAQMLLAHTLRVHFKSRNWKPPKSLAKCRNDAFIVRLLTWFADFSSKNESVYSLHNMVAAGFAKYETLPGEWYGPGTACYVLRDLVTLHNQFQPSLFRVYVAPEGTIYRDKVRSLMTTESKKRAEERKKKEQSSVETPTPLHPLDISVPAPPVDEDEQLEWDTALLILIPLRLGLNNFNETYREIFARSFWLPQSVGVLGGRPRAARWFFGAYADGTSVLGLDPHTVQTAPQRTSDYDEVEAANDKEGTYTAIDLSDDYMQSVHTSYPEVYPINRMDPSIALGFYCRDKKEFAEFELAVKQLKMNSSCPDLFTIVDKTPNYSSAGAEGMMDGDLDLGDDMPDDDGGDFDDDDYVLL